MTPSSTGRRHFTVPSGQTAQIDWMRANGPSNGRITATGAGCNAVMTLLDASTGKTAKPAGWPFGTEIDAKQHQRPEGIR
ncbi:hypothetical protein AB0J72_44770 [Dactylosporangium sp. NPDC049742]|uniref:hypothetical protein n=1 Tax=Dactylosporangium sp. NPDC049742 TaxID=3154737 RepID=UPI00342EC253